MIFFVNFKLKTDIFTHFLKKTHKFWLFFYFTPLTNRRFGDIVSTVQRYNGLKMIKLEKLHNKIINLTFLDNFTLGLHISN